GCLPTVPAKMTSCIFPPRSDLALCSPITQVRASTTLDFPEPLGPTTAQIPGSNLNVVGAAKDLKPLSVSDLRYTGPDPRSALDESAETAPLGFDAVHHQIDGSRGPAAPQRPEKCLTCRFRPLGHHVDATVRLVGRVAGQSELEGATAGPPAKAHALDVPVHPRHHPDVPRGVPAHSCSCPVWMWSRISVPACRVRPTVQALSTDRRTSATSRSAVAGSNSDMSSS